MLFACFSRTAGFDVRRSDDRDDARGLPPDEHKHKGFHRDWQKDEELKDAVPISAMPPHKNMSMGATPKMAIGLPIREELAWRGSVQARLESDGRTICERASAEVKGGREPRSRGGREPSLHKQRHQHEPPNMHRETRRTWSLARNLGEFGEEAAFSTKGSTMIGCN
ncbi:hypothetical protein T492DRAFT_844526 [Pavlovales sp. CCMP2436]|nr:hypothetical protein T492DRAFT_844526 [Pavlovales sp. CCMP2436]